MLLEEAICQAAGDRLLRVLGGLVLLCVASHALSLLRQPPRVSSRRTSRRHAPPAGERPPRAAPSCCAARLERPPAPPRSSDHSSAWLAATPRPAPPPSARILLCSVRREAAGPVGTLGQVIYDARQPPAGRVRKSPVWRLR